MGPSPMKVDIQLKSMHVTMIDKRNCEKQIQTLRCKQKTQHDMLAHTSKHAANTKQAGKMRASDVHTWCIQWQAWVLELQGLKCTSSLRGFKSLLVASTKHTSGIIYNVTAQRPCISREHSMHSVAKQFISHAQHMLRLTDTAWSPVTSLFTSQSNVDACNAVLLQTFKMHSVDGARNNNHNAFCRWCSWSYVQSE